MITDLWPLLLQQGSEVVQEAAKDANEWTTGGLITLSIGLLILAVFLIVIEFLVISGGLIGVAAGGAAVGAIAVAFSVHPVYGWVMLALVPIVFFGSIRTGIKRMLNSSLVTQATIDGDAGYEQVAEERGVAVGSHGTMVTDAFPTGRCHFEGGELDVSMESGSSQRGDKVVVTRMDGPEVWVQIQTEQISDK